MSETKEIPVDKIKPSPYQPRIEFDLEDLKGSILRDGILVPITVRKVVNLIHDPTIPSDIRKHVEEENSYYELIDGERRTRLAKELGYETILATIIDVDDDIARRMVWKVNTLRKDYKPEEKARYFKKLQDDGMSLNGIAKECEYAENSIVAHLNVLKLPEKYQKLVWKDDRLSIAHIQELRSWFNGSSDEDPSLKIITNKLDLILERKLTSKELREVLRPELAEIEKQRVEAAKKAAPKIVSDVKVPESPDELRKAAEALKREAKRKEKAKKTPEQLESERLEKEHKKREREENQKAKREAERKAREERERKIREEAEAKARTEEQAKAKEKIEEIREVAKEEAKQELKKDREFIREVTKEIIKPPLYEKPDSEQIIWEPPRTIENPLRYLSIGLKITLYNKLTHFMEDRKLMREPAIIHLIEKGLEVEGYGK